MSTDAQPAESSPAPSPSQSFDLETMTPDQRTEWRLNGTPSPDASKEVRTPAEESSKSSPAESTPAEPAEQAASTDASSTPASEPGTPEPDKPATAARFKKLLDERTAERARADKAERELATLKSQQAKPDVPAVPSPALTDKFPEHEVWEQIPGNEGKPYNEYMFEEFEHRQALKHSLAQRQAAQDAFTRTAQERVTAFTGRYREALATDATLPSRIDARLYDLKTVDACLQAGEPVTALNAVAQEIVESPSAVKLLVHLSEHPDELARLSSLSPAAVIRAMARLEGQLDTPAIPPPKTISSAPPLTTTLGTRPAVPGDPVQSAVKAGDFRAYRDAANAREMAAK